MFKPRAYTRLFYMGMNHGEYAIILTHHDPEQPKSNGNILSLYRIADMEYFQEQTNKNAQLKL